MRGMTAKPDKPTRGRLPVLPLVFVFLVLYVLAPGPLNWLFVHGYISQGSYVHKAILVVHRPLMRLLHNLDPSNPFSTFMEWWMELGRP